MKIGIALSLAYLALIIAGLWGWVVNLIDVVHAVTANDPFTTLLIVRIIGIPVAVLGAVLGYF
jgi:hypothetical protein